MNMTRLIPFLCFFVFLDLPSVAQQIPTQITGKVMDERSHAPLGRVKIYIENTSEKTITDNFGRFTIPIKNAQQSLCFSLDGYEKKTIQLQGETESFTVALAPKVDTLHNMAEANSLRKSPKHIRNTVIDYSLQGDSVLVLSYMNNRAKLTLLSPNMDTISQIGVPRKPTFIFKDCLGNNHIVYEAKVYQVLVDNNKLQLAESNTMYDFERVVYPCVGSDSQNLYFTQKNGADIVQMEAYDVRFRDMLIHYYFINKNTKQYQDLSIVLNPFAKRRDNFFSQWLQQKENYGLYIPSEEEKLEDTRGEYSKWRAQQDTTIKYTPEYEKELERYFAHQFIYTPTFAPMFNVNDTMYIFNYSNSKIQCYHAGNLFDEIEMRFHKDKYWKRDMFMDHKTKTPYAVFEKNGVTELRAINLKTGNIANGHAIPYAFPEKILVNDNYIYFLRIKQDYTSEVILTRQKIQ